MKELDWEYDNNTAYWAIKCPIPIESEYPYKQYNGRDYPLRENTWKKHISKPNFPEYSQHPQYHGSLLASPSNIIKCYQECLVLEALALTVAWGRMTRAKGNIFVKPNSVIEETLLLCLQTTANSNSVEEAWNLLVSELGWNYIATSKCLHFLARSFNYDNPPVPLDNTVILGEVWPAFRDLVKDHSESFHPAPKPWWDDHYSWNAYNRYMTAILCWADHKGWTTTQLENTLFEEYYPRK